MLLKIGSHLPKSFCAKNDWNLSLSGQNYKLDLTGPAFSFIILFIFQDGILYTVKQFILLAAIVLIISRSYICFLIAIMHPAVIRLPTVQSLSIYNG